MDILSVLRSGVISLNGGSASAYQRNRTGRGTGEPILCLWANLPLITNHSHSNHPVIIFFGKRANVIRVDQRSPSEPAGTSTRSGSNAVNGGPATALSANIDSEWDNGAEPGMASLSLGLHLARKRGSVRSGAVERRNLLTVCR